MTDPIEDYIRANREQYSRPVISDQLIAAGMAGILVPSTRLPGGRNLVLWRWNDAPDRRVIALNPQSDLPRDQSSWPVAPATRLR